MLSLLQQLRALGGEGTLYMYPECLLLLLLTRLC